MLVSKSMNLKKSDIEKYENVEQVIYSLLEDEDDWISAMATVVSELHNNFSHFNWTGFYRVVSPGLLKIGPYQGTHGCITIPFTNGVCGSAALTGETQLVPDVRTRKDHIACSATTLSEIVIPVISPNGDLFAVLDVDSDKLDAFTEYDINLLKTLCDYLGRKYC